MTSSPDTYRTRDPRDDEIVRLAEEIRRLRRARSATSGAPLRRAVFLAAIVLLGMSIATLVYAQVTGRLWMHPLGALLAFTSAVLSHWFGRKGSAAPAPRPRLGPPGPRARPGTPDPNDQSAPPATKAQPCTPTGMR
jgi:hypothetical protein